MNHHCACHWPCDGSGKNRNGKAKKRKDKRVLLLASWDLQVSEGKEISVKDTNKSISSDKCWDRKVHCVTRSQYRGLCPSQQSQGKLKEFNLSSAQINLVSSVGVKEEERFPPEVFSFFPEKK